MDTPDPETSTSPLDANGRLRVDLACARCGYNLRSLSAFDFCPHCKLQVARSFQATLEPDGRLCTDRTCLKCGYNLRSLSIAGHCPECNLPVAHSVRGNLLQYANPDWARQVANGAGMLDASRVPLIVALITVPLARFLSSPYTILGSALRDCVRVVAAIAAIATLLLVLVGSVVLTAPEPRLTISREGLSARRVCRFSLLGSVALPVLAIFISNAPGVQWAALPFSFSFSLLLLAGYPLGLLGHVMALSRRLPDASLAKTAKALAIGIVILDAALSLPLLFELFVGGVTPFGLRFFWACIILPIGLPCAVVGLILAKRARDGFARAAEQAATNAEAPKGDPPTTPAARTKDPDS